MLRSRATELLAQQASTRLLLGHGARSNYFSEVVALSVVVALPAVLYVHIGVIVYYHFNAGFCNGVKESSHAPFLDITKNIVPVTLHVVHTICTSSWL